MKTARRSGRSPVLRLEALEARVVLSGGLLSGLDQVTPLGRNDRIAVAQIGDSATQRITAPRIDWGDGSTSVGSDVQFVATLITGYHTYASAGTYTVTTTATLDGVPGQDVKVTSMITAASQVTYLKSQGPLYEQT